MNRFSRGSRSVNAARSDENKREVLEVVLDRCAIHKYCVSSLLLIVFLLLGCRYGKRLDTVLLSVANPSHTLRTTVLRRQYLLDNGMEDASATTYVLLDKDTGTPSYVNGKEFSASQVVMRPSQSGPLKLEWMNDQKLKIICDQCGLALHSLGNHAEKLGSVQIIYEGFPAKSFSE